MKKNESEVKVIKNMTVKTRVALLEERLMGAIQRIAHLEEEIRSMQRGDNTGFKHENDGGWFD